MKNKHKILGNKKTNRINVMIGILIIPILLMFLSVGVSAAPEIEDGPYVSPTPTIYTNDTIKINWTTNETSKSDVYYFSDGAWNYENGGTGIDHSVSFGPLTTPGDYDYRISLCNESGEDCTNDTGHSFEVSALPCPAPVITPGSIDHSPTDPYTTDPINIAWNTDESSTSRVYYKLSNATPWNDASGSSGLTHSVSIGLLDAGNYTYKVSSCNPACLTNCTNSTEDSFTVSAPPCPKPSITSGPQVSPSNPDTTESVTINWETNEDSTSEVYYKLSNESSWTTVTGDSGTTHFVTIGTLTTAGTYNYTVSSCNTACLTNCTNQTGQFTVSPPPVYIYNVSIRSSSNSGSGKPYDTLQFTIYVKNTGDLIENFTVTVNHNCENVNWDSKVEEIPSGSEIAITPNLEVMLPIPTTSINCTVNVTAESQTNSSVKDTNTINLTIIQTYGVEITSETTSKTGGLGQNVTYTLTVKNIGSLIDTYNVSASTTPSLPTTVIGSPVNCGLYSGCSPGGQGQITVTVTLPQTAVSGTTYTTTVTAESNTNSSVKDSINLTTTIGSTYNFSLSCQNPSSCYKSGGAGSGVSYILRVNNLGNANDTYDLTATATTGATLNLTDNVTVAAVSYEDITLTVFIPSGTTQGTVFYVNVTATSQGNSSLNRNVTITANTTGVANGIVTGFDAPANASLNSTINFSITFKNTGSITVNATSKIIVGSNLFTIQGQSHNITPNEVYTFDWSWVVSNTNLNPGESYWLYPQVDYGGLSPARNDSLASELYILSSVGINITPLQVDRTISPNVEEEVAILITNTGDSGTIDNVHFNYVNPNNLNVYGWSPSTFTLNPKETQNVTMYMNSSAAGTGTGTLNVFYTIGTSDYQQAIPFNINVASRPILTLIPDKINYINSAGSTSGTLTATIKNNGNQDAQNIAVRVIGLNPINMNIQNYPLTIFSATGGGTNTGQLTYNISIQSNVSGTFTGQLEINYTNSTTGGTKYTSLFDITVIATLNVSSMSVSPTSISVSKLIGSLPEHKTITITNDGNEALTNIQVTPNITGVSISVSPSIIESIPIAGSVSVAVTVNIPSTAGTDSGNIKIYASDQNITKTVTVTVTATHCGDGSCNFGETCSSCPGDCGSCPSPSGGGKTHCLRLENIDDYTAKVGDTVKIKIEIENCGKRDEEDIELFVVEYREDECPSNWDCEEIKDIEIDEDESETEYLEITIPENAALKTYKLTAKVDNDDDDDETFNLIVGAQCSKDADCKSDEFCENRVCRPKKISGKSCTRPDGSECESGICSGGVCIECESEDQCAFDEYCSFGDCVNKKEVGEDCSEDYECTSESCVDGKCIECESNNDCGSGEYCDEGVCRNLKNLGESCESNDECSTGRCVDGECGCVSNSDCAGDEYCVDGKCKKKITEKVSFDEITITPENVSVGDTVTIRVTSNGNPVGDAIVLVGDKNYRTNVNGEFNFTVNETGTLNVVVSKSGYNELTSEILVEEKEKPGFWTLWRIFIAVFILLIILVVVIIILIWRKKGEEEEVSLQTLRGFREKFDYTSHEIKEKIKELMGSKKKEEYKEEAEEVKGIAKEKEVKVKKEKPKVKEEVMKEEVKKEPKRKIIEEEPELLSIEDITLPPIEEIVKKEEVEPERRKEEEKKEEPEGEKKKKEEVKEEKKEEPEGRKKKKEEVKEEKKEEPEGEKKKKEEVKEEKKEEPEGKKKKKEKPKKEEESTPWSDLLKEKD